MDFNWCRLCMYFHNELLFVIKFPLLFIVAMAILYQVSSIFGAFTDIIITIWTTIVTWLGIIVWKHQKCHDPSYILSKNERKKNCTQHLWPSMLKFEEFVRRPQALKMPTCKQITMGSKNFLSQSCLTPSGKWHCCLSKGGSLVKQKRQGRQKISTLESIL